MADELPHDFIRMEGDRSIDWDMEEREFFSEDPSSEKMHSAVQKGCSVGKKLLITGLAISSAPVVLPPLVIMSAFGFVASIPYGVFLASYACTQKVMSVWLPIPPSSFYSADDQEMVEEDGYQLKDLDEYEEDYYVMETTKRGEVLDVLNYIDVVVVQGYEEDGTDIGSGNREAAFEVTNVEFEGNGDLGDEEEQLEEIRDLLKRIEDEVRREDDFAEANGAVDYVREVEISMDVDEPSDSFEENVHGLLNEVDSAAVHPHGEFGTFEDAVSSKPAKFEEAELPSVTIIDAIKSEEDLLVSTVTIEPTKVEANAQHTDFKVPSNEELSSEVKIKERIDSMKKIIGYKATPLVSYIDEVNALYAFVGVEPPSPSKVSSDDDELNLVNQKLQFLMAIVGVK